ncbi:MAG: YdeI/OmpD-associated family protein [Bacteroidota bacterium]
MNEQEKVFATSASDLRAWLLNNYERTESVWLVKWKKDMEAPYFGYDEMVDELIAFGWVDSLPKNLDKRKTMYRISPRNPKSNWSRVNKERVERLSKEGKMHASGIKLVNLAKENGTWDFLNEVENLMTPTDLDEALKANGKATFYYDRFPNSSKRNILEWIKNAKQAATRKKRIDETAKKAALNIKANHPKGRDAGPKE